MFAYDTWTCQTCLHENREDVYPCPTCEENSKQESAPPKTEKNLCPECTYENPEFITHCQVCDHPFLDIPKEIEKKPSASVLCKSCHQQNHAINEVCVFCENDLYEQPKKKCPVCYVNVKENNYDGHVFNCQLNNEIIEKQAKEQTMRVEEQLKMEQRQSLKSLEECIHCREKLMPYEAVAHQAKCKQNSMKELIFDEKTRMSALQMGAIHHMHLKSEKEHNAVKKSVQQRIGKLGYSIEDLNNLQYYIENYAPIIIHCHVAKHMQFFVKDTHYRSQFETNKSSGSLSRASRTTWEDRMFDKKYSKAKDFERVKYGVINFTNDPKGVKSCTSYGPSYMLLKEHVRQRCTFTDMDSSAANASIATFRYCFKILSKMNDAEVKAAFDASKAKQVNSGCTSAYKQIQIHGPIEFKKDVQCIYVNRAQIKSDKKLLDMVYQFSKNNEIEHDFV